MPHASSTKQNIKSGIHQICNFAFKQRVLPTLDVFHPTSQMWPGTWSKHIDDYEFHQDWWSKSVPLSIFGWMIFDGSQWAHEPWNIGMYRIWISHRMGKTWWTLTCNLGQWELIINWSLISDHSRKSLADKNPSEIKQVGLDVKRKVTWCFRFPPSGFPEKKGQNMHETFKKMSRAKRERPSHSSNCGYSLAWRKSRSHTLKKWHDTIRAKTSHCFLFFFFSSI